MNMLDLIRRRPRPIPWEEGDNIPWNEPGFSERMLQWHLSQTTDAASRRFPTIDRHVSWIHRVILQERPSRILDLGCGPGLYTSRLAQLGHTCVGADWSPASIRYANQTAQQQGLACTYKEGDIRQIPFGQGFDLVMFVFGEFNVFKPEDAGQVLEKARFALLPGGKILLEAHTFEYIQRWAMEPASWYTSTGGLFSPLPHLQLEEGFWDDETRTTTRRFFIVDGECDEVIRYAASYQAYTEAEYRAILEAHGFQQVAFYPSLTGEPAEARPDFIVIQAEKG